MQGSQHHPGKTQEKSMVYSGKCDKLHFIKWTLGQLLDWIPVFLKGGMNQHMLQTLNMLFFSNSVKNQFRRLKSKAMMLCSNFCFILVICLWVNSVFHQNRAQTHRRVAFVAAPSSRPWICSQGCVACHGSHFFSDHRVFFVVFSVSQCPFVSFSVFLCSVL